MLVFAPVSAKTLQGHSSAYRLESQQPAFLGRLAILYRAKEASTGEDVILKMFRSEIAEPGAIASFYAELDAVRTLEHPNILPILDHGEADGARFLVCPYCRGGNLRSLLSGAGFVPLPAAMPLLRQVAAAIDYAHSQGIIHGDLKPENILLSADRKTTYLADFGVSRHFAVVDRVATTIAPSERGGAGTSAYLSPEQLSENRQSASSDVYAFSLLAYELLTGRLPFDVSAPPFQQMLARVQGNLVGARSANPLLNESVSSALMTGLAAQPSARPRSAASLCELLSPSKKWDVFIAYASPDRAQADDLFEALSSRWRVFLDHRCLRPGDNWDTSLSAAQRDALITIVLVSSRLDDAYYQREEVAAAIDLARRNPDTHRVVPIYLEKTSNGAPYGLRIKHGLFLDDAIQMQGVISKLHELLESLKSGASDG